MVSKAQRILPNVSTSGEDFSWVGFELTPVCGHTTDVMNGQHYPTTTGHY